MATFARAWKDQDSPYTQYLGDAATGELPAGVVLLHCHEAWRGVGKKLSNIPLLLPSWKEQLAKGGVNGELQRAKHGGEL